MVAHLREEVRRAVEDRRSLDAMRRSFDTILARQAENASRVPDIDQRRDRLRRLKEECVGDERLLARAMSTLRENGFRVIMAKSADAAVKVVADEVAGSEAVVKSKSNITKELHLADRLGELGVQVVETDLGDRIVQLAGCRPVHPTGPACHMSRGEISELLSAHFGRSIPDDPGMLTTVVRDEIAGFLDSAKVGITGANAIAASEGTVVIVHNEGNAARCASLPDKHIVVTTPEKVVPTLEDALNVVKLQTYYSTGKIASAYVNMISGPSYTADIEKRIYRGMHGPREVVVVIVDDGRLAAEDREPMYCIGCGSCLTRCPVYRLVGPVFGTTGHMGGQGAYLETALGRPDGSVNAGLHACTSCGACTVACPASIDARKGIIKGRQSYFELEKDMLPEHDALLAGVRNYDNPWQMPRARKARWAKRLGLKYTGEVLYFAGCSTSLLFPDTAVDAVRLLRAAGVEPAYLGPGEKCCGATAGKLGDRVLSRGRAEACFEDFSRAGARTVVVTCPGCMAALNSHPDLLERHGVEVLHISQFLSREVDGIGLGQVTDLGKVAYHDPCDLGRDQGVFDEPRRLIEAATGSPLVELPFERENAACCGAGSGVRSGFEELARAIGLARIDMAVSAGADTVVTACPWCVQNLRECQEGSPRVKVVDLVELLGRAVYDE